VVTGQQLNCWTSTTSKETRLMATSTETWLVPKACILHLHLQKRSIQHTWVSIHAKPISDTKNMIHIYMILSEFHWNSIPLHNFLTKTDGSHTWISHNPTENALQLTLQRHNTSNSQP
jgi:hypothetical protein